MTATYPEFTQTKDSVDSDVTSSGNLSQDNAVRMSISAEGTAHIMSLLTDLYSNPELAVLREYSCNALDSHKAAGQTKPIIVTLPSRIEPIFSVQDFGVGMSRHDIETIYSSYGASTKRNDFTQVGAFGLGCKAALTLTQQFTLVSVKDGMKTTAIIHRGDDGVGTINVVAHVATPEENGVTVRVPVENTYKFNDNVNSFFYTWENGSVLVDGKEPKSVYTENYYRSDDNKCFITTLERMYDSKAGLTVVMGEVPYKIDYHELRGKSDSLSRQEKELISTITDIVGAVVIIPIGSVDLTPSREGVRYSPRTVKFLNEIYQYVADFIPQVISKQVADATTRGDALEVYGKWKNLHDRISASSIKSPAVVWNGEGIPTSLKIDNAQYIGYTNTRGGNRFYKVKGISDFDRDISLYSSANRFMKFQYFVLDADDEASRKTIRRDLAVYIDSVGDSSTRFFIFPEAPTDPWITECDLFKELKVEDIKALAKKVRAEERKDRVSIPRTGLIYPTFDMKKDSLEEGRTDEADFTGDEYIIEHKDFYLLDEQVRGYASKATLTAMFNFFTACGLSEGDRVIYIAAGRKKAALEKRSKAEFTSISESTSAAVATIRKNTPKDIEQLCSIVMGNTQHYTTSRTLNNFHLFKKRITELNDTSPVKILLLDIERAKQYAYSYNAIAIFSSISVDVDTSIAESRIKKIAERYPLLGINSNYMNDTNTIFMDHAINYINTVDGKE